MSEPWAARLQARHTGRQGGRQELHSREALAPIFAALNQYDATTHFVGQSTILTLSEDRATGEAYCLAHHVTVEGGKRRLMVASLRYLDTFVRFDPHTGVAQQPGWNPRDAGARQPQWNHSALQHPGHRRADRANRHRSGDRARRDSRL
jgi:hypothetical protein